MSNIKIIRNCEPIKIKYLNPGDIFVADEPGFNGHVRNTYVYTDGKTEIAGACAFCITDAKFREFRYEDEVYRYDEYFVTELQMEFNVAKSFESLGIGDVFMFDGHTCVKTEEYWEPYGCPVNAVSVNSGHTLRFHEETKVRYISNITISTRFSEDCFLKIGKSTRKMSLEGLCLPF